MAATRQSSRTPDAQAAGDTRNGAEEAAVRRLSIDTIRALAMDAVQKANAGHPGTAMALAPLAYTIFERFLRANPNDPAWPDRDRFILSSGHACMLQYAVLHLTGYDLGVSDLEEFRQWGSRTPGHPERGDTPGIEVTTGPLGQGISNSVGFAMAERFLAERFNRPGNEIVDHHTYVICSDGDMMEGVSQEAASIAGHFALGKLIVCYDDNHITIDGTTAISFDGENHGARMEADGWHTQRVEDSEDVDAIEAALQAAREEPERPSFISIRSHIAYPAPKAIDTAKSHGAALGEEEVRRTKEAMGFDPDRHFWVDESVYEHMSLAARAAPSRSAGQERFRAWREAYPDMAADWDLAWSGRLRDGWRESLPTFAAGEKLATRVAGQKTMAAFAEYAPTMIGGAADLVESTKTLFEGGGEFSKVHAGRNVPFGIREHGMGAIVNGAARARRHRQALRLDVPEVLGLHARRGAAVGADGAAGAVGLDARLGRARRGRPDPPAGRALHLAARDPEALGVPPGRPERDLARLAGRARTRGRPGRAPALAPEHGRARPRGGRTRRRRAARRLRAVGRPGW